MIDILRDLAFDTKRVPAYDVAGKIFYYLFQNPSTPEAAYARYYGIDKRNFMIAWTIAEFVRNATFEYQLYEYNYEATPHVYYYRYLKHNMYMHYSTRYKTLHIEVYVPAYDECDYDVITLYSEPNSLFHVADDGQTALAHIDTVHRVYNAIANHELYMAYITCP